MRPSHDAIQTHFISEYYGIPPNALSPKLFERAGKVILKIVGGDGAVSQREQRAMLGSARTFGAPDHVLEQFVKFDHVPVSLDELVDDEVRSIGRTLLYDAIRIARVDGFDPRERSNARKAAITLGLDPSIVQVIEGQLIVEDAVREARLGLLWGPQGPPPAPARIQEGNIHPELAASLALNMGFEDHGRRERYGLAGPMTHDLGVRVGQAILVVATGDGALSQKELLTFLSNARATGAPKETIDEFVAFDPRGVKLNDLLDASLAPVARIILYEALTVARADGLEPRERAVALRAAKLLNVEESVVHAMIGHLGIEAAVRESRIRHLSPG